jgi:hypothetical protein
MSVMITESACALGDWVSIVFRLGGQIGEADPPAASTERVVLKVLLRIIAHRTPQIGTAFEERDPS